MRPWVVLAVVVGCGGGGAAASRSGAPDAAPEAEAELDASSSSGGGSGADAQAPSGGDAGDAGTSRPNDGGGGDGASDLGPVVDRADASTISGDCFPAGACELAAAYDPGDPLSAGPPALAERYSCTGGAGAQPNFPRAYPDPHGTDTLSACGNVDDAGLSCCSLASTTEAGAPAPACAATLTFHDACNATRDGGLERIAFACPDGHPRLVVNPLTGYPNDTTCWPLAPAPTLPAGAAAADVVLCCPWSLSFGAMPAGAAN
jgi:hypothetical protein